MFTLPKANLMFVRARRSEFKILNSEIDNFVHEILILISFKLHLLPANGFG